MECGKEGGTWIAMNRQGNMAFLHNINFPITETIDDMKGRGDSFEKTTLKTSKTCNDLDFGGVSKKKGIRLF